MAETSGTVGNSSNQKAIDVFELVYQTGLIPIPPKLDRKLFWNSRHSAIS